jgi:tetratricopeptide (TPR) repeat protein/predicted Ser/Thr protein kinase
MIGHTISHFRIIEKLGEGGMGAVYLAEDTELDRKVALKFLPEQFASDQDALARFQREAKAAAALNHPNIITIHEIGEHNGKPFIAMAYVEGDPLTDAISEDRVSTDRAIDFALQICSGLEKAHGAGIVHRDIKPDNLLVDRDGHVKILDFGLAKVYGVSKLTDEHSTVGTLNYMSPEQARGEEVDHRSDLFSLGAVLYEILAGRVPFSGEHPAAVMYAIASEEPQPLPRFNNDVSADLCAVVDRALSKDPAVRYQSAADMAADLRRAVERGSATNSGPPRRSKKKLLLPVVAVAIVVAMLLIFQPFKFEITPDRLAMAGENTLAVMYFENMVDRADSTRLGEIATNLLITDLSESESVKVLSSQRLYDILKLKGKEGAKLIDRETATEVARHAGVRRMLLGSILQTEPNVLITARLVDVSTGEIEASQRVAGEAGERVFALIDRLSDEVRKDLELPAESSTVSETSVADATTHNREAYRSYLEGIEYERRYYHEQARYAFKQAAELDSNFAMAHYALARLLPNATERLRQIELAQELSSNLGQREKRYINSAYAYVHGDIETAIREMKLLVETHPDEKDAYNRLGALYQEIDEQRSIGYYRRAIEIDPLYKDAYNHLAYLYQDLDEFDNAIWAITQYINLAPDEPNPYDSRAEMYGQDGKLDQAIESYQKALAIDPEFHGSRAGLGHMYLFKRNYERARKAYQVLVDTDSPRWRVAGREYMAYVPRAQGKWEEATRILHEGIAADEQESGEYKYLGPMGKLYPLALANSVVTWEEGLSHTQSGLDLLRRFDPSFPFVMSWEATELFWRLKGGQITAAEADSSFASLRTTAEIEYPQGLTPLLWIGGNIAFAQGRYEDAIEPFEESVASTKPWFWYYPLLECYLEMGRIDDAVKLAERLLRWHDYSRTRSPLGVTIHYLAGQAYQTAGQTDKAIEQFQTFLMIWKDADPIFPEIDDAKQRLEFLKKRS